MRHPRRVQVAFWKPGETAHSFSGYTTNMSVTGMFIGTNTPLARGSRLRIEVLDQQRGFLVEAVVTHSIKAPQQLQAVRQSGMGVRLLKVEELVANFLEGGIRQQGAVTQQTLVSNVAGAIRRADEAAPRPPAPAPNAALAPAPPPPVEERIFKLHFTAPEQFLAAFRREMQNGGLFVPAVEPAAPKSKILIEIHFPREGMMPLLVPARVTQSYSAQINHGVAGMAVEFEHVDSAVAQLEKVFALLRNSA